MKNKISGVILIFFLYYGCSTVLKKEQESINQFYFQGDYKQALSKLKNSELKKDPDNLILYLMYKGKIKFSNQEYEKAAEIFEEAIQKFNNNFLETKTDQLKFIVLPENTKLFSGEFTEISLLFYYQTLSFFNLVQEFQAKKNFDQAREYIFKGKASLLNWDAHLSNLRRSYPDKIFVNDLINKIMAANFHEIINTSQDKQIAIQLYKDALNLTFLVGPTLKSFNENDKDNLDFILTNKDQLKKQNFDEALKFIIKGHKGSDKEALIKFRENLALKILELTLKIRSAEFNKEVKILNSLKIANLPSKKELLAKIKSENSKKLNLVKIILQNGSIGAKKSNDYHIGLRGAIDSIEDEKSRTALRAIGIPIITYFALGPLGLGHYQESRYSSYYVRHNLGTTLVEEVGIEFSLAELEAPKDLQNFETKIISLDPINKIKDFSLIKNYKLPLNEILSQNLVENNKDLFFKRGVRIASKYIVAILAAYSTYKGMSGSFRGKSQNSYGDQNSGSQSDFLAKAAAMATFLALTKGIKNLEKADLRSWQILPANIDTFETSLPEGKYQVQFKLINSESLVTKEIEVKNNQLNLFSFNL